MSHKVSTTFLRSTPIQLVAENFAARGQAGDGALKTHCATVRALTDICNCMKMRNLNVQAVGLDQ